MVNPNINSFAQTPVDGELDLSFIGPVVSARTSNSQVTALIAGQAVAGDNATPSTSQDGVPPVISLASNSVPCVGFVARNIKDQNFPANARLELAMDGACMYKTSSSTIARFAPVEFDIATNTVLAWGGINPICGFAYDAAVTSGDLIRILIKSPQLSSANTSAGVKTVTVTATLAQINAGLILIPGSAGKKIDVLNVINRVTGTFASGTSVELESTNASPVAVLTYLEAAIAGTTVLYPNSANVTTGAGFSAPLGTGDGLQVVNNGSAQTGGTSMQFTITYTQS